MCDSRVWGYLVFAVRLDLVGGERLALNDADAGAELFAHPLVGHAHHVHVGDLVVVVKELFELARINVLAAADHHVLQSALVVKVAVLVHSHNVTFTTKYSI